MRTKHLILLPLIISISCAFLTNSEVQQIRATNSLIKYTGRTIQEHENILLSYSGSSIEFKVTGKKIQLYIVDHGNGDHQHTNYLSIEINGNCDSTLQLKKNNRQYDLSLLLKEDTNTIKIFKRTEASVGVIEFQGLTIGKTAVLLPIPVHKHKLLWIGNSLTCGYGNELNIPAPPNGNPSTGFSSKNENNYNSWSSITSRALAAENQQVCFSGKGVYRNFDDSKMATLPMIFNKTFPNENYTANWNHKNYQPELTIINLSTNDFGPEMNDADNLCDSALFVNTYIQFLNELQTHYPNSEFILVVGNALTDYWPANLQRLTRCRKYINSAAKKCTEPERVSVFELSTQSAPYGEDWHPNLTTHKKMSSEITPFITQLMNW